MTERVLTGDRVTGKLHLGHYAGSLQNRVLLQEQYESFVFLADVQALTTHFAQQDLIRSHIREMTLDYLSAGIDPEKSTIFIQSMIPEIAELTIYFSMFVSVNSLRHNPTIKAEAKGRGLDELYYGFLGYPVSQAADITFCKATIIPVGEDQLPHLELARRIVRRFNELYQPILVEPQAMISNTPRLAGTDGNAKMSKSLGNAIALDSTAEDIAYKIKRAVTDPARVHKNDPGHPEICPIYAYHSAFQPHHLPEIREGCERGTMGCSACKERITMALEQLISPMRERRAYYAVRPHLVNEILITGTQRAQGIAKETMKEVREAMKLDYFSHSVMERGVL
ncbi:tryptophan--tRNA ligase [Paenibacillus jilunlii]|uniref:Tryptophan--tRNA ligase n=1 Tax=Paenibacillus jilunlii TaxID=682956 RepID=A0A1G9H8Z7_9BACL|nr:tryptophan--tRNA ligase [Paenibacillus jilunlii]KWX77445.1 tryptophan--tRNA ligase [Paenibacillus jilunlii]SDL09461.1 tryptophanyl-tRNA synthetase [Paenibacillus jilunlii]